MSNKQDKHSQGTLEQSPYKFGLLGWGFDNAATSIGLCQVFGSKEQSEADAARIIQCWNEYDQLRTEITASNILRNELQKRFDGVYEKAEELQAENEQLKKQVEVLRALESGFYMNICRAYNAGKQSMNNQHTAEKNGDPGGHSQFISSHSYFTTEFPEFTTNVP